jgi:hypothetical protein
MLSGKLATEGKRKPPEKLPGVFILLARCLEARLSACEHGNPPWLVGIWCIPEGTSRCHNAVVKHNATVRL